MTKVTEVTVKGQKYVVNVSSFGVFYATVGDDNLSADTFDALVAKIQKKGRAVAQEVDVKVSVLHNGTSRDASIRGIHSGHGRLLMTDATGKKFTLGRSYTHSDIVTRRLSPDEHKTYHRLYAEERAARKAHDAFIEKVRIADPHKLASTALENAADAEPPEPPADPRL